MTTTDTAEDRTLSPPPTKRRTTDGIAAFNDQIVADYTASQRDERMRDAAAIISAHPGPRGLPEVPAIEVARLLREVDTLAIRAERAQAVRDAHLQVVEPRVYGDPANSYILDLARAALPGTGHGQAEAQQRLDRHASEVANEARLGSAEGQRALRVASTLGREGGHSKVIEEQRAMTSAVSSGGSFVTPQHLVSDYGLFRSYAPSFYEQTKQISDDGYGMTLYLPVFTSTATAAQQLSENTGVTNSSPTAGYLTASMVTFAGEITVSRQLFDRAGPIDFDQIAYAAMMDSLMQQLDSHVLSIALTTAGTVSGATAFTAAKFFGDLAKAKSQMVTTAGTKLPATHLFLQPSFGEWLLGQVDPSGRPLMVPTPAGVQLPFTAGPNGTPGYTGCRLLSTAVFEDGSITATPTHSTRTRIIAANMGEVFTLMSEPVMRANPDTLAEDLAVVVQVYAYIGAIVRHHNAVQVLASSAYPASPSFA